MFVWRGQQAAKLPAVQVHPDGELITGERLTLLFAGDPDHKEKCQQIIEDVGFIPQYVGPIRCTCTAIL